MKPEVERDTKREEKVRDIISNIGLSELAKPLKGCQNNDTKLEKMRDTISTTSVSLNSQNLSKGANMLSVNPEAETRIAN